jgi:arylsulfatase A-like enzyme
MNLKKQGLNKNTYIIFTSDHGEEFEDHNGWWHGFTLYQEMLHVPLIVKVPDSKANPENMNKKVDFLVRLIDVSATIPKIAGIQPPETFEGTPLLSEEGKVISPESNIYAWAENDAEGQIMQSIRDKTHKLILANPDNPRRLEPEELYDLSKDAKEKNNLSNSPDFSSIKQNLHQKMNELKGNNKGEESKKSSEQVPLPPELIEQLKAQGICSNATSVIKTDYIVLLTFTN